MTTGSPEQPNAYAVELALAAALARITDAQDVAITQAWARAWSETSAELLDILTVILGEVGQVNAAAVARFERLARVLAGMADRLDDLAGQLGITVTNDLADVLDQAQLGTVELIAAQRLARNVPGREVPTPALEAIVRRTTQQVTSRAVPLADETYAIVLGELTKGVAAGDNPRATAARMVDRAENLHNFGRSRAVTIARTETLDAYREGARVSREAHADLLAGWAWVCHLGPRTCRSCLAMHGQVFGLDVRGPDDHQQGRCTGIPVVREEDGSVDLSWLPSAEEHFARLPEADQRAVLGNSGYEAWVAGDFPIEDWTKRRENDGWRDSQVPASPGDSDAGSIGSGGTPPGGSADPTDPGRPSMADFIVDTRAPGPDHEQFVEDAWRTEMDRTFGDAGLRAEMDMLTFQPDNLHISGTIYKPDGSSTGGFDRVIHRDATGTHWADHSYLAIDDKNFQGTGFAEEFNETLYAWYRESGFDRVELDANIDIGGYAWASRGYKFADQLGADNTIARLTAETIGPDEDAASVQDVLDRAARFAFGHPNFPTARQMSQAGRRPQHIGRDATWPGKRAMIGLYKSWRGVQWLK